MSIHVHSHDQRSIIHGRNSDGPNRNGATAPLTPPRAEGPNGLTILCGGAPITVRVADTNHQRNSARTLVNRMYSWRGYGDRHVIPQTPTHTTFTASSVADTIGTITLAVDSPAGLAADALFRDEIDTFRNRPGAKTCELTKLAFDSDAPPKQLLAAMFHLVFIYGYRRYKCTDLFIEVNPRHVRFYEAMLGFQRLSILKTNDSVSAPSQLMWLKVSEIRDRINQSAGGAGGRLSRSLYPHFFSPTEEDGLFALMVGSDSAEPRVEPVSHSEPVYGRTRLG